MVVAAPADLQDAIAVARQQLRNVPTLIPVVGHRFLPAELCESGNPVLSVWQMVDTIYYGRDLRDFFAYEDSPKRLRNEPLGEVRCIRFWSGVVEEWYGRPSEAEPGAGCPGPGFAWP